MPSLDLFSPAKLNLYLQITGKYPNGYHRLRTLFHRISFGDTIRLSTARSGLSLKCSNPKVPNKENLITKAYDLLKADYGPLPGVEVRLNKKIPLGAGLGGGSGNAATFLLGMNKFFKLGLSKPKLLKIGSKLGADVSFFLTERPQALGLGRGERLSAVPVRTPKWFVLALSEGGMSTAEVYRQWSKCAPGASLTFPGSIARIASQLVDSKDVVTVARGLHNDLEYPAFHLNPDIQNIKGWMVQLGAPATAMSGSGSTVFSVFTGRAEANQFAGKLMQKIPRERVVVCHSF